jgi:hypothetical protein
MPTEERASMASPDQISDLAVAAIRQKHAALAREMSDLINQAGEIDMRMRAIHGEMKDCEAAARVFGGTLEARPFWEPPQPKLDLTGASTTQGTVVRSVVLQQLEQAFPGSVKAADIREVLANMHVDVHEKTVGMTLYRLSLKGLARRIGIRWFFVPEDERGKEKAADAQAGEPTHAASTETPHHAEEARGGGT